MKKIFLSQNKKYFKANLHCHSTVSDGQKTPEELKVMYKEQGYSIIAYTDHNILLDHSDLCDDEFLALNGMELDISEEKAWEDYPKNCHICYIALEEDNLTQICYNSKTHLYSPEYRKCIKYDKSKPDYERKYTHECINDMIKQGRENGFFVTYNHPAWSLETLNEYGGYHGMNAMEICNYGCTSAGYTDYNEKEYDDMLRGGEEIFCISTDDNHNGRQDSFGGFTFINADKLEYRTITKALENGDFYASQGPEIYELWYENGKIGIKCSECASIRINTGVRRCDIVSAENADKPITDAEFDVCDKDNYVRLTVTDFSGRHANTNAYFVKNLK